MKKYISTIAAGLLISTAIFAQTQPADTLLRRQMELDREFNPTLMDVQKINSLPALPQPTVHRANTNFSTWAGLATPPLEIAVPPPGTAMTEIPFQTRRGYMWLNAGNYANVNGALGYRLVDDGRNALSLNFLHNSTNGEIRFLQEGSDPPRARAFVMDNFGQLRFQHLLREGRVNAHVSYLHSMFNYYGNTFGEPSVFGDERQQLGVLNANVGFEMNRFDRFNVLGSIGVKNFSTYFGETLDAPGIRGNEIDARFGFNQPFQAGNLNTRIGVDGRFFATIYGGDNELIENYSQVVATPYIAFSSNVLTARLGADAQMQFIDGNRVRIVPNIDAKLLLGSHSSLWARAHGGFNPNTFLSVINDSRYVTPIAAATAHASFTVIDVNAGVSVGQLDGFRFDIFGGFKHTENQYFLKKSSMVKLPPGAFESVTAWGGLKPIVGNLSHSHIGGRIQSNFWAPLDLSLQVKRNFYTVTEMGDHAKAYGMPGMTADIRATLRASNQLSFTMNYHFANDRWAYFRGKNAQMNNINDLNIGAMYRINDSFSLNVRANNVLFQRYDIWFGHPAQGFNASGGFTFLF